MDFEPSSEQQMLIDHGAPLRARPRSSRSRPSSIPMPRSWRPRTTRDWYEKTKAMGSVRYRHPGRVRRPGHRHRHPHPARHRDVAASRRSLRALLRHLRWRRAWRRSSRPMTIRRSATSIPTLRGEKKPFFGLTEPSGGSDPARAIKHASRAQGATAGCSTARRSSFQAPIARNTASSSPAPTPSKGRGGITCFIVDSDTPGFHVRRVVHTLRSSSYATELEFKDCWVSDHAGAGRR